uniref:Uncharacterized protein n=1 Tax=Setaria italica TaxID=4555 RepID=K3YKJ3_SETIT
MPPMSDDRHSWYGGCHGFAICSDKINCGYWIIIKLVKSVVCSRCWMTCLVLAISGRRSLTYLFLGVDGYVCSNLMQFGDPAGI